MSVYNDDDDDDDDDVRICPIKTQTEKGKKGCYIALLIHFS
jgi:hypothetical protein